MIQDWESLPVRLVENIELLGRSMSAVKVCYEIVHRKLGHTSVLLPVASLVMSPGDAFLLSTLFCLDLRGSSGAWPASRLLLLPLAASSLARALLTGLLGSACLRGDCWAPARSFLCSQSATMPTILGCCRSSPQLHLVFDAYHFVYLSLQQASDWHMHDSAVLLCTAEEGFPYFIEDLPFAGAF